eukprot:TRINITY_DN39940_c0_g1_i1.p1 TRINITY_DN39940_c0_g1~~TRINITY_DN39940_c0_g1_i1.p1  ORF type:complete len:302 (+),score=75.57 TRINITY_DN39940_c0_g1_i1:184-1089(+)
MGSRVSKEEKSVQDMIESWNPGLWKLHKDNFKKTYKAENCRLVEFATNLKEQKWDLWTAQCCVQCWVAQMQHYEKEVKMGGSSTEPESSTIASAKPELDLYICDLEKKGSESQEVKWLRKWLDDGELHRVFLMIDPILELPEFEKHAPDTLGMNEFFREVCHWADGREYTEQYKEIFYGGQTESWFPDRVRMLNDRLHTRLFLLQVTRSLSSELGMLPLGPCLKIAENCDEETGEEELQDAIVHSMLIAASDASGSDEKRDEDEHEEWGDADDFNSDDMIISSEADPDQLFSHFSGEDKSY